MLALHYRCCRCYVIKIQTNTITEDCLSSTAVRNKSSRDYSIMQSVYDYVHSKQTQVRLD